MDEPNTTASASMVLKAETEINTPQPEQLQPPKHNENINETKSLTNNSTTRKDSTKQPSDKPQNFDKKTKKIIPNDYTVKNFNNKNNISARDTDSLMHLDNKKNTVNDIIVKADLVNKAVVMHAQTKENNHLEIVKKTTKTKPTIKILPRDTNKTVSSSVDNVNNKNILPMNKNTALQASKKTSSVHREKPKNVNTMQLAKIPIVDENATAIAAAVQNDHLTYAQMVGPVKTSDKIDAASNGTTERQHEMKDEKVVVDKKPPEPETPKTDVWQTVRPKGKKRIQAMYDAEQINWNDVPSFDGELQSVATPPVHHEKIIPNKDSKPSKVNSSKPKEKVAKKIKSALNEVPQPAVLIEEIIVKPKSESIKNEPTSSVDENIVDTVSITKSKLNKSKTDKPKKSKAKKQVTKDTSAAKAILSNKTDKASKATINDNDASLNFENILGDVDISNFGYDPNSSMFVNALTTSLFSDTEKIINGTPNNKPSTGFSLNNSLTLMKPFGKTKENIFLKEEEDMVIRVMNSINQKAKKDDDTLSTESQAIVSGMGADQCNDILVENGNISVDDAQSLANSLTDDESLDNSVNDGLDQNSIKDDEDAVTVIENLTDELDSNGDTNAFDDIITPNGTHNIGDNENELAFVCNGSEDENECISLIEPMPENNSDNDNHKEESEFINENEVCSTVNGHCTNIQSKTFEELFNQNRTHVIEILSNEIFNTKDTDEIRQDCQEPNHANITINLQRDDASFLKINDSILQESDLDDDDNDDDDNNLSSLSSENNDDKTIIESQLNDDCTTTIDDLQNDNEINTTNADTIFIKSMSQDSINGSSIIIKPNNCPSNDVQNEFNIHSITDNQPPENGDGKFTNFYEIEPKRNQSPRHSEDSGILEYQDNMDDLKYFSDTCEEIASKTMVYSIEDKMAQEDVDMKFPVTEAVSRWLMQKQKEKSPEPILRLPDNPMLTEQIGKTLKQRLYIGELFNEDDLNSDSDTEYEFKQTEAPGNGSKNLISNPLHVLFARNNIENTYKRVAEGKSVTFMDPDLLDGWDIDVATKRQPPMHADVLKENDTKMQKNPEENSDLNSYESFYGHSINYANLLSSNNDNDIFLSNNIRNYNDINDHRDKPIIENNTNNISNSIIRYNDNVIDSDKQLLRDTKTNNNRNDNINDKKLNSTNLNCFKPPEICCILM